MPWWGLVSSAVAPVLLVGGWTVAAGLQPGSFNAVTDTISSLAAEGAADRWVMTARAGGGGGLPRGDGLALRPAASAGRLILMAGGVATVLVAAFPERAGGGGSLPHRSGRPLVLWPWRSGRSLPGSGALSCRRGCGRGFAGAAGVLLGLLVWFGAELIGRGRQVGLAERVLAGARAGVAAGGGSGVPLEPVSRRMRHECPAGADTKNSAAPGDGLVAMTVIRKWARRVFKALGSVAHQPA